MFAIILSTISLIIAIASVVFTALTYLRKSPKLRLNIVYSQYCAIEKKSYVLIAASIENLSQTTFSINNFEIVFEGVSFMPITKNEASQYSYLTKDGYVNNIHFFKQLEIKSLSQNSTLLIFDISQLNLTSDTKMLFSYTLANKKYKKQFTAFHNDSIMRVKI